MGAPIIINRLKSACQNGYSIISKIYYQQIIKTDFKMFTHRHALIEIMYAVNNAFFVSFIREERKQEFVRIKQGEYIIINEAVPHRLLTPDKQVKILNIEFQLVKDNCFASELQPLYENSKSFRNFIDTDWDFVVLNDQQNILAIIKRMHSLLITDESNNNGDFTDQILLKSLTNQLFLESGKSHLFINDQKGSFYVQKAIDYINSHYDEDIKINDIANNVSINHTYLEILFKKYTQVTIIYYINKQRILRSLIYLSGTKISIIEIAVLVGFNNRQHFTRIFQQIMHTSPGEYRKKLDSSEYKFEADEFILK